MFGFLMGLVLGAIGGAAYGSRYFRDTDLQTQFNDTQDRLTNLMSEVRSVLDETRGELRQAWEKTRESAVEKTERLQAAAAGKIIALQKPIALTLAEADRIVAAVERHAVPFTMAWQMRVDPQNIQIKELLDSGLLGKISMLRRRHGLPAQQWDIPSLWHFDPALNRDIWADDSAHPIDFIHWLLGVPESVTAEIWTHLIPNDHGVALFRYANGVMAEVTCSFTCLAAENTPEAIGLVKTECGMRNGECFCL